ncbi:hypothetical protein [Pragia fontium]|uniref:hypothetical protein n=1 Tax=Pragia fontium TaxID=82985 RepID=UPI0006496B69|nr:hypothetical protein [Pragia fontium]AKJ41518.1 hypothetical protein QQ39_05010 [Pragia fontium]
MGKVTMVFDFPDGHEPAMSPSLSVLGGKLCSFAWGDALPREDSGLANIDTVLKIIDEYAGAWVLVDSGIDDGSCRDLALKLREKIKAMLENNYVDP